MQTKSVKWETSWKASRVSNRASERRFIMIHPSYVDLMKVMNSDVEIGEEPVVNSRYSIVMATAKRARPYTMLSANISRLSATRPIEWLKIPVNISRTKKKKKSQCRWKWIIGSVWEQDCRGKWNSKDWFKYNSKRYDSAWIFTWSSYRFRCCELLAKIKCRFS